MRYFLTSDTHFGHANIIKYCNRPFKSVCHMNRELVRRWNERVKEEDMVYFLGDFCFKNSSEERGEGVQTHAIEWIRKLNGIKFFIRGNHDKNNSLKSLVKSAVLEFAGKEYYMVHDPAELNREYLINFVGHVHNNWKYRMHRGIVLINIGVDVNNFYPQTIDEVLNELRYYRKNNKLEDYTPYRQEVR